MQCNGPPFNLKTYLLPRMWRFFGTSKLQVFQTFFSSMLLCSFMMAASYCFQSNQFCASPTVLGLAYPDDVAPDNLDSIIANIAFSKPSFNFFATSNRAKLICVSIFCSLRNAESLKVAPSGIKKISLKSRCHIHAEEARELQLFVLSWLVLPHPPWLHHH